MKTIILLCFITSLLSISCATTNISYKCGDELKLDTCHLTAKEIVGENTNYVYYVNPCKKGKKCEFDDDGVGTCVKRERTELLKQGEKCKINEECKTEICDGGKCGYIEDGAECQFSESCKANSVCTFNSGKVQCTPLVGKDSQCYYNVECKLGLLCNGISKKCTPMFSLDDGEASDQDYLCKSGKSIGNKCVTTSVVDATCTENKCKIKYDNQEQTAFCVRNNYVEKWLCPLQSDSQALQNYIKTFQDKVDDIDDEEEFDVEDMSGRYTLNYNTDLLGAYTAVIYDSVMKDADDCVKDFFYRQASGSINKYSLWLMLFMAFAF